MYSAIPLLASQTIVTCDHFSSGMDFAERQVFQPESMAMEPTSCPT